MVPLVAAMFFCRWLETERQWVVFSLGGVVFLAGVLTRVWAQMHLRHRLKVKMTLTSTGPYGYVRNPLYIGNTLILVGLSIMAGLVWLAPITILYCAVVYTFVVRQEESRLRETYGEPYLEYVQRVPRWIPHFRSPPVSERVSLQPFLMPSVRAELHNFLFLAVPVLKELVLRA